MLTKSGAIYQALPDFDTEKFTQIRAGTINKTHGKLTGYECKTCLNRGYMAVVSDSGEIAIRQCKCQKVRRSIRILDKSGLSGMVSRCTFALYREDTPWQADAKRMAQEYAENPDGRWFVASGNAGSGKTHLCVAICRELMLRGNETRYVLWRDEATRMKAVANDRLAYDEMVNPLKTVPVLYIDDFFKVGGSRKVSDAEINLAFEILNARYNDREKITVISTERSMGELLRIDEALGSRIYERGKGSMLELYGSEKNWRMRNAD